MALHLWINIFWNVLKTIMCDFRGILLFFMIFSCIFKVISNRTKLFVMYILVVLITEYHHRKYHCFLALHLWIITIWNVLKTINVRFPGDLLFFRVFSFIFKVIADNTKLFVMHILLVLITDYHHRKYHCVLALHLWIIIVWNVLKTVMCDFRGIFYGFLYDFQLN